ncbi:MAG: outer membrane protein assembly factor BamA, partial [Erythrobacter sp.]|nr:outer membrane protein assembly factor BamA [Erythrobacter sp.]
MNRRSATGGQSVTPHFATSATGTNARRLAFALTCGSMLAGVPYAALAQDEAQPEATAAQPAPEPTPAPTPAPAPAANTIRTISVAGAERLEPTTILSYIRLRVGQEYTSVAADQALKDLGATELFSNFSIRNDAGNVVITVTENPVINRIVLEG